MAATEFNDAAHYGFFMTGTTLTSGTGKYLRQSELTLAALRAAGLLDRMVDGTAPPATDKLWLDKNLDPAVLKEWDPIGSAWQPMKFERMFERAAATVLTVTGGTANAITASQPSVFISNRLYSVSPTLANTGPTTITVAGVGTFGVKYLDGSDIAANEFAAGRPSMLIFRNGRFELLFGYAAQVAAEAAQAAAEVAAASLNIPTIATGTAKTALVVKGDETGYEFGAVARLEETGLQTMAGPLAAPYVLPSFRGLKISEFLTSNDITVDQSVKLQEALTALTESNRYSGLDGEGKRVLTNQPLSIDMREAQGVPSPRTIANLALIAGSGWTGAPTDPILRAYSGNGTRVGYLRMSHLDMQCAGVCNGILLDGNYYHVALENSWIRAPYRTAFDDGAAGGVTSGNGLRISGCHFFGGEATVAFGSRVRTAVRVASNDVSIQDSYFEYFKHSVDARGAGSLLIGGVHAWQGNTTLGAPTAGHTAVIRLSGNNPDVRIYGSYIDNGYVEIEATSASGATASRGIRITDTLFTIQRAVAGYNFIAINTNITNLPISDWLVSGCTFRALSSETVTSPMARIGSGSIDVNGAIDVVIEDNSFSGAQYQTTKPDMAISLTGATSYGFDFSNKVAFNLNVLYVDASVYSTTNVSTPVAFTLRRSSGKAGNILLENGSIAAGQALIRGQAYIPGS